MRGRMQVQQGFSFIEVLVAMFILGISVMAFAGLQMRALGTTGEAHLRAQATSLASELVERVRANRDQLARYRNAALYDGADLPAGDPFTWNAVNSCLEFASVDHDGCSTAQMARFDINEVEYLAGRLLPQGRVRFAACDGLPSVDCVFVSWRGVDPADCADNASPNCIMMQVAFQ